jgi:hypothetical protein
MSDDDEGTFSIRVVDERGHGVGDVEVACQYGRMSGVGKQYTNEDGWAEFPIIPETLLGGIIPIRCVWVNDVVVHDLGFSPEDGDTFSFTLP